MTVHDIEDQLRAQTPTGDLRPPVLPETDVSIGTAETPVGRLVLAGTERGIIVCSYEPEEAVSERIAKTVSPRVLRHPSRIDPVRAELDAYFEGRLRAFSADLDMRLATGFRGSVLRALTEVPYGSTTTYSHLANRIGRPKAARAVGNALSANPLCVIMPCHRVVPAGGGLGGYAGGPAAKELLLQLETAS